MNSIIVISILFFTSVILIAKYWSRKYTTTTAQRSEEQKQRLRQQSAPTSITNHNVMLTVVVPCFNEEDRLLPMLYDTMTCLDEEVRRCRSLFVLNFEKKVGEKKKFETNVEENNDMGGIAAYEVLVIDDCSTDRTADVATKFFRDHHNLSINSRVVRITPNKGKGHAVRCGFFEAMGDVVLMADGDNATQIDSVLRLHSALMKRNNVSIAIGSRAHLENESIATRTLFRTALMYLFHFVVLFTYWCTTRRMCTLRDTQCGFKLFRRKECSVLFENNRLERWAFDVEIMLLAKRLAVDVVEVPVNWTEVPGSKVRLGGMLQMGLECLLMCFTYPMGFWTIKRSP